jgi:HTH-like domain
VNGSSRPSGTRDTRVDGGLTSAGPQVLIELRRDCCRLPRGCGDLEADGRILRHGDPVNLYRFTGAAKADRRNVARVCALLKVATPPFTPTCPARRSESAVMPSSLSNPVRAPEVHGPLRRPRMHAELRRRGRRHSRKRIARLMRRAGIAGKAPKRRTKTIIRDPAAARADKIRRDFTYIGAWEGWLYLATVIDIASRRIVGYAAPIPCAPSWSPVPWLTPSLRATAVPA